MERELPASSQVRRHARLQFGASPGTWRHYPLSVSNHDALWRRTGVHQAVVSAPRSNHRLLGEVLPLLVVLPRRGNRRRCVQRGRIGTIRPRRTPTLKAAMSNDSRPRPARCVLLLRCGILFAEIVLIWRVPWPKLASSPCSTSRGATPRGSYCCRCIVHVGPFWKHPWRIIAEGRLQSQRG